MRWLAAWVLLAGCDLVFPIAAAPPGDGAPDDRDGQPDAPAVCDGPDEDNDGVVDVCDNCPHLANADQENDDGDDLGDACDSPIDDFECIALFDGFEDPKRETFDLENAPGEWQISGGQLVQSRETQVDGFVRSVASYSVLRVEIGFHYAAPMFSTTPASAGVWLAADPPTSGVFAEIGSELEPGDAVVRLVERVDGVDTVKADDNFQLALGEAKVAGLRVDRFGGGSDAKGTLSDGLDQDSDAVAASTLVVPDPGPIALRTDQLAAQFDWVLVITRAANDRCPPR